jgi:hypothetical protein
MTTMDDTSSEGRGKAVASHSKTRIDIASSSDPGMRGNDAEFVKEDAPDEGGERSRGRTMLRRTRSFDIAKGFTKTVTDLTSNTEPGNEVAPALRCAEQPIAEDSTFQIDPQSATRSSATSIGTVKTPVSSETTSFEETERDFQVEIRHEPESFDCDLAAEELFPDKLILDTITERGLLGKGTYGRVHAVKVIGCGEHVKRRLIELSRASEVPKDYRVALKTLTWEGAQFCACSHCATLNQLRRRKGLAPCPIFLPDHVLLCGITRTFLREITALKQLVGIAGIQQLIGYEVYAGETSAKFCSKYPVCDWMALRARSCEC